VTTRCLRWRDAMIEVLSESAGELNVSCPALAQALAITQRTLDVALVRICETFEHERARIADELTRREDELAFTATHDSLTGLPNRTLILDRGERMLSRARRSRSQMSENPEGETLLRTLVQIGKALSIETLAEGIEREQLSLLREASCDSGQGYLFARPLSVADAEEFLVSWHPEELEQPKPTAPAAVAHRALPRTRGEPPSAAAPSRRLLAAGGESS
jgi:predicted signal transduction protein with EAL and GGDEF domain